MAILIKAGRSSVRSFAGVKVLAVAAASVAAISAAAAEVSVHPHACVMNQRSFNDLDALVAAVHAAGGGRVAVAACGSAAIPAWLATVQRLSDSRLEIGVVDASAPGCAVPSGPMRVSQNAGGALAGVDPVAVERYWRQVQP
jgi:hypothetical protein